MKHKYALHSTGHYVFVTGAAGGIGLSICEGLLENGARVVATDLKQNEAILALQQKHQDLFEFRPFNLGNKEDLAACVGFVRSQPLTGLVNNAAVFEMGSVLTADMAQYEFIFSINVAAAYALMQAAAISMQTHKIQGSIVNFSSQAGRRGEALVAHYCASKAAIISYTQSAALALAKEGIRVNAIAPGVVDTPMWKHVDAQFAKFENRPLGEKKRLVGENVPLGRMGLPEDITKVVLFLLSDLAGYITGQTINVDGGNVLN